MALVIEAEWRIYASAQYTNIGLDNGLAPNRGHDIIRTNAALLSIRP